MRRITRSCSTLHGSEWRQKSAGIFLPLRFQSTLLPVVIESTQSDNIALPYPPPGASLLTRASLRQFSVCSVFKKSHSLQSSWFSRKIYRDLLPTSPPLPSRTPLQLNCDQNFVDGRGVCHVNLANPVASVASCNGNVSCASPMK